MADVQLEQGWFRIATKLAKAFARVYFSPYESQVIWELLISTYGYNRKAAYLTPSLIAQYTGISRSNVSHTLKRLITRNVVVRIDYARGAKYHIQKDFDKWVFNPTQKSRCSDRQRSLSNATTPVVQIDNGAPSRSLQLQHATDPIYTVIKYSTYIQQQHVVESVSKILKKTLLLTNREIKKFFKEYTPQQILNALDVVKEKLPSGRVRSPTSLFFKALSEGWLADSTRQKIVNQERHRQDTKKTQKFLKEFRLATREAPSIPPAERAKLKKLFKNS